MAPYYLFVFLQWRLVAYRTIGVNMPYCLMITTTFYLAIMHGRYVHEDVSRFCCEQTRLKPKLLTKLLRVNIVQLTTQYNSCRTVC